MLRKSRCRVWSALIIAAIVVAPAIAVAQENDGRTHISRLGGNNKFHTPVESIERLQALFIDHRDWIEEVLALTGWGGDIEALHAEVAAGRVEEVEVSAGGELLWMAYKKRGSIDLLRNVVWDGRKPFKAYQMTFRSNNLDLKVVVPQACGNLALASRIEVPPPICKLIATPSSDCVTRTFTIDGSKSTIASGSIAGMDVTLHHPDGRTEALGAGDAGRFTWTRSWTTPGTYRFDAVAMSDKGRMSEGACTAQVEVKPCPPTCDIRLSVPPPYEAMEVYSDDSFSVDVSGSTTQVGTLAKVDVEIVDSTGAVTARMELASPFQAETDVHVAGRYTLRAVATDSVGQRSENACHATIEILPRLGWFANVMVGTERRWRDDFPTDRSAPLIGGKVGPRYRLRPRIEVAGAIGGSFNTRDGSNSGMHADLEMNYVNPKMLLGAGVGVWDFTHNDTVTGNFLLHGGFLMFGHPAHSAGYIELESRFFFDHADMIDNNYLLWAGLRYYWR